MRIQPDVADLFFVLAKVRRNASRHSRCDGVIPAEHEREGIRLYHQLLELTTGRSVVLEEYAREMTAGEEMHLAEIDKMLRRPGSLA